MKIKQYVLREPKTLKLESAEIPILGNDDVLIKVQRIGICGSDAHLYYGSYSGPHSYPILFGHEWSGKVEKTGKNVSEFKKGDIVTGDCSRYCNNCENCLEDKNLCTSIEKFGITIDGASAEYIVRNQKYLYKRTQNVPEKLLCLCEPIAVAAHLIAKIKKVEPNLKNKKILVMGGGAIGLSSGMLLKDLEKVEDIDLYDISSYRNNIAKQAGLNIPQIEDLKENTSDGYASMYASAKYDIIIETTGNADVFSSSFNLLKPNGILGCVGMIPKVEIPQKLIVTKSLIIVGSIGGTGNFDTAMQFIAKYPHKAEKLISHCFSIDQADKAFDKAINSQESLKVVLEIS